ncbi:hypothetical protein QFC21_006586 [Naganishia friedmannii]|uniref:Uncharacterized protein n=1 Tax=Naganishia friedmannii TaxID=89922 RepID=A0ACC2V2D7_9TREE|nr:hypothetical protein QFC21_006586 [Naganishia friedmannii]
MEENSRKRENLRVSGVAGGSMEGEGMLETRKGQLSIGGGGMRRNDGIRSSDHAQAETMETSPTFGSNAGHRSLRQSTILSAIFLSLLPLPAAAYPQSRNKGSRRDRKRSSDPPSVRRRDEGDGLTESARNLRMEAGWEGKRRYHSLGDVNEEWAENGDVDVNLNYKREGVERQIQTSEQTSDPLPTKTLYARAGTSETSTATATSTTFPIPVPVTVLPYKMTMNSDGLWTTVNGGWTLYGRASVNRTHNALANADDGDGDGYDITTTLPIGWGQDSVRGNLYAVPLIVVASVCLASLFIVFVIVVVISRAKVKRKVERRKRREAAREKKERRERRLTARAIETAGGDEPDVTQGIRRPSVVSATTVSTGRRSRGRFGSASSMTDSEDDQDGNATPRQSGSLSTLRQAKLAAAAAAADLTIAQQHGVFVSTGRAGKAKKRFGWTSAVHAGAANSAAAGGVGTARLGDPRRVWGWKKGLRRRGNRATSEGGTQRRGTEADVLTDDGGTGAHSTAVELSQTPTTELPLSATAISPANLLPELAAGTEAQQNAETTAIGGNSVPLASRAGSVETARDQVQGPSVSAFPPAYYQAPSAPSNAPSVLNGRVTNVGPSARAMEKRAMPTGREDGDYFPAPTTEEQEQAVDIAYNRNLGLAPFRNGDTSLGGSTVPPLVGHSNGMQVVPAGSSGHVATDDKQVLERLRMAGSAPLPGDSAGAEVDAPVTHRNSQHSLGSPSTATQDLTENHINAALQASAPELLVDEDGFERLDDGLLPPDDSMLAEHSQMNGTAMTSRSGTSAFPLPPAPIAQHSLAYAQPSAPLGMHPSSPLSALGLAGVPSAPSAPFEIPEDEEEYGRPGGSSGMAVPSAPLLFNDGETDDANMLGPSEMPSDTTNGTVTPMRPSAPPRRFTVPHRTLGVDLPADLAATATTTAAMAPPITAPPAFSNPESSSPVSLQGNDGNGSSAGSMAHVRFLPRYEP